MRKYATYYIALFVMIFSSVVLFGLYKNENQKEAYLQSQTDQIFSSSFSGMYSKMFCTELENVTQEEKKENAEEILYYASVCKSSIQVSSYQGNASLVESVGYLYNIAKQVAIWHDMTELKKILHNKEIVDQLGYLRLHLNDIELSTEVWRGLSS